MAYDVDRRPGTWVTEQARRRTRRVWAVIGLFAALALASVALLRWNPAPIAISVLIILAAFGLRRLANHTADDAMPWLKGARAERSVGEELNELRREGFTVMHDVEQLGEGNIDHLVSGPTGVFLVETKYRGYEKKNLAKVKRQAAKLNAGLGTWITPVVCLHVREGGTFKHEGVWIVPQDVLLEWIRGQRNATVPFERLARFADGL
jgi:Nuclease-related domain